MQDYFFELADRLTEKIKGDEVLLMNFSGEQSEFVRLNRSAVRQAGSVKQAYASLELIRGSRHAKATVAVGGDESDRPRCEALLAELRTSLDHLPEDPHLLYAIEVRNTEQIGEDTLPDAGAAVDAILTAGRGRDMVGIYAQGGIHQGFANSLGQRNWFATHSFQLDWTFYHAADKAVKANYAGGRWSDEEFGRKVQTAAEQLAVLSREPKTNSPGAYRAYLAPAALREYLEMVSRGGFGLKAHRTKTTPLLKMLEAGAVLAPSVTLAENTREGIAPNFQSAGFVKPEAVTLVKDGRLADPLVSPRSAKEYSAPTNAAAAHEMPESLDMAAGDIPADEVLKRLDTGVYVNTLWYLNFSDRPACRITGLTRFATFWVAGGEIVAPLNVMRFDDTVYRLLGEKLVGLTDRRDFIVSTSTYGGRSTESVRLPGALVEDFALTL